MNYPEAEKRETGISGCFLQPLAAIPTPCGPVLHLLREDYALMPKFPQGFGEIYFSEIYPGCVKAWKRHKKQTQHFAVPTGKIKIALFDSRHQSPTNSMLITLLLGRPDHYQLLCIPPGIWYGFQCVSTESALVCNCADLPHEPAEGEKLAPESPLIPFAWHS